MKYILRKCIFGKCKLYWLCSNIFGGGGTSIGFDCSLITSSHTPGNFSEIVCSPIKIWNNCFIGNWATILPGVTIGDNVTIGACSVVTKDLPSNCVAVGNPAKVIRFI